MADQPTTLTPHDSALFHQISELLIGDNARTFLLMVEPLIDHGMDLGHSPDTTARILYRAISAGCPVQELERIFCVTLEFSKRRFIKDPEEAINLVMKVINAI